MEFSLNNNYFNGCKSFKPSVEFISYGDKGVKQLKTYIHTITIVKYLEKNKKLL